MNATLDTDCGGIRRPVWALLLVLVALSVGLGAARTAAALDSGEELRSAALSLGEKIDAARARGSSADEVGEFLLEATALGERARDERRLAEADAGENELALERLYRSAGWDGLNFALAASRYWQSWLYLDRFARSANPSDLSAARHGFQTTLVLIVYPGLVRGSWLGMGYAALAGGESATAKEWFDRVASGDDPLAATARREVELLAALDRPASAPVAELDAASAEALEAEALALLARHGRTLDGARAAAERLRQLEAAGALTPARVRRLLAYRDEVIGQPIGPVAYLVSAEDALDHAQYYTAVQKYQSFFAALDDARAAAFAAYRLRYADGLLLSGLYERAIAELEPHLDLPGREATARSLLHVAQAMRFAAQGGEPRRRAWRHAANRADDAGAAFSRHLLGGDPRAAGAQAQRARREDNPWFSRLPAFELVYREFAATPGGVLRDAQAELGLALARQLDGETRKLPWMRLARADMQAQLETDPRRLVAQLDKLAAGFAEEGLDRGDALLKIRLGYLKERAPDMLVDTLQELQPPLGDELGLQLLAVLLPCTGARWCLPAMEQLMTLYPQGSDERLALQLERIRLLGDAARDMDAYDGSRELVADYPASGDAWQLYAQSCERVGRAGDADQAYAHLVAGVPVGSAVWREAQLARLRLRLTAGAKEEACALRESARQDKATFARLDEMLAAGGVSCLPRDRLP